MPRDLSPEFISLMTAERAQPFLAFEMFFDSGTLRLWTGLGDLVAGGETYTGSGSLISVSDVEETGSEAASSFTLTLSGADQAMTALALGERVARRRFVAHLGFISEAAYLTKEDGGLLLLESGGRIKLRSSGVEVVQFLGGYMDKMPMAIDPRDPKIMLVVQNENAILNDVPAARFTPEYQKQKFPGDKGFEFVASLAAERLYWGAKGAVEK